jgi:hypothetical protein
VAEEDGGIDLKAAGRKPLKSDHSKDSRRTGPPS